MCAVQWYSSKQKNGRLALRLLLLVQHQHFCDVLGLVNNLWKQLEGFRGAPTKGHFAEDSPYSVPTHNLCQRLLPWHDYGKDGWCLV